MTVFVSYAREQQSIAEEISLALSGRGHDVFLDRSTLEPGREYGATIQKNVETCDLFVFLISPEALGDGSYARTELGFAKKRWKNPSGKILPVMVRPTLDSRIDAYLRAVTILYPQGNVAAEVAARATALLEHTDEPLNVPPSPELQRERIASYKELWRLTKLLPKWPRSKDVTYEDFGKLSQLLRDWYFNEGGGIFLSRTAHTAYAALQDSLTAILVEQPSGGISEEHYEAVRVLCSTLRSGLAHDVGSRQ
ncbi:MAG: toll/interleukin-1 receptor domain-containing protein [Nitrospirota bacterium]